MALVDAARKRGVDVTADVYPYLAWSSNIKVLVPNKQWTDPASVKEALDDIGGGRNVQITRLPMFPQYVGRRLDEIARAEGVSEVDLYIRIVKDEGAGMIGHTMIAADMQTFLKQPWAMVASDGGIANNHPRGAGTFPRVLGRFVRDEQWLTLPDAIRKMTSMPAARLGLKDRGTIAVGMKADLVLFDPATVLDLSTFESPRLLARGIHTVLVNGVPVWSGERATGTAPRAGPGFEVGRSRPEGSDYAERFCVIGVICGPESASELVSQRELHAASGLRVAGGQRAVVAAEARRCRACWSAGRRRTSACWSG